MFWRRKNDGFDWHKHVRTTIKLRREARKQRLGGVVDVAVGGIKGAGRAGASASYSGIDALNRGIIAPVAWLGRTLAAAMSLLTGLLARPLEPAGRLFERPGLAPMLGFVAVVAGLLGLGRARVDGWDLIALLLFGGALAILALLIVPPLVTGRGPAVIAGIGPRLSALWRHIPGRSGMPVGAQRAVTGGLLVALLGGAGWLAAGAIGGLPSGSIAGIPGFSRPVLEGTASIATGDSLRIDGQLLSLTGIEAPALEQQCGGQGREPRWRCGEAARTNLRELVRGKTVRCELGAAVDKGASPGSRAASCKFGSTDIAAELVSRGHVFAQQGLFSSYGRLEQDARNGRRGVWRGTAERPEEYRARLWEAAKKAAPEGCPIKGQITRNERTYVVPWSASYTKVRIRPDRGERWFCTEQEAQAAGFRPHGAS